jgi:hypothetical protein
MFALGMAYRFQYIVDSDPAKAARAVALLREFLAAVAEGDDRLEAVRFVAELTPLADKWTTERAAANQPQQPAVKPKTELMIVSKPSNAKARIDQGAPASTPAVEDVTPGKHAVHVEADGFFPEDAEGVAVDGRLVAVEVALRERPAIVKVDAPDGATVAVDGKPVGVAPLAPISVVPGPHFVAITERGHEPYTRDLKLGRGDSVAVHADLHRTGQRRAAYLLAAGTVVVAAAGVVATGYALSARSAADSIVAKSKTGNITPDQRDQQNQDVDDFQTDTTISRILYGGAAALAVTAVVLYFADEPSVEAPQQPSILITPVPTSGGMTLTLTRSY